MTVDQVKARAAELAQAIRDIPDDGPTWRQVRHARTVADTLAMEAAALGEPATTETVGEDTQP